MRDYSGFIVFWYLYINTLKIAGANWFLSLPNIDNIENSCCIKTMLYDFFVIVTYWIYYINLDPFYGSDNKSVLSVLIINNKFNELIVLYEFFIFYIDLFKI